jgi:dihydrofolate reductase
MRISLIAAMTPERVIAGPDGGIPWDLPRDRAHFRSYTSGKWMLVGRKTYEEMEGWFGTRTPLILTRNSNFVAPVPSHRVVGSVSDAIELTKENGIGELVISGGAEVYETALPCADRLVLTIVETEIESEIRFPECRDPENWAAVHREVWPSDEENAFDMTLQILDRRDR